MMSEQNQRYQKRLIDLMAVSQKMIVADCLSEKGFLEGFVVFDWYYNSIDKEIRLMFTQDMRDSRFAQPRSISQYWLSSALRCFPIDAGIWQFSNKQ